MKNIKFKLIPSLIAAVLLNASCDKDDATGYSTLIVNNVTGSVTPTSDNLVFDTQIVTSEENEDEFIYTVTLSKKQPVNIHVKVTQLSGTAILGEDVEAPEVIIQANSLSASGKIKVLQDCKIEGTEDITIQIGGDRTANASIPPKIVKLTIQNYISSELDLTFTFDQPLSYGDPAVVTSLCQLGYDVDFYVLDENLNDMGIYDAATGNCVEHLSLNTANLPNGIYYIYYDIWDNGGIDSYFSGTENFAIPIKVDYSKCGSLSEQRFVQESSFHIQSSQSTGSDYVMTIEVLNGVATIKNSTNDVIATGRFSHDRKIRVKNAISKARAKKFRR